MNRSDMVKLLE